ncbi:unnamed protein product [Vitrella brassicaformis CCMP3155]|uniref:Uncharacterized protein n=1 Tax=Vitrella brassicaformis (strain CCMP3155) TaxID=1169540 RepID=A0A0G4EDA6_VITBC|nr:unnamed protein product [Vitrella brassicaformis CCMP3155]|eukprot:CEL93539.1 unnamed protein product [Vitrella brassicaformis CCMP3155]
MAACVRVACRSCSQEATCRRLGTSLCVHHTPTRTLRPGAKVPLLVPVAGDGASVDVDGERVGSDKPKRAPTDTDHKAKRSELVVPHATGKGQSAAEGGHPGTAASAAASASSAAPPPAPHGAPVDNKALLHKMQIHGSKPSTAVDPEAPAPAGSPTDGQPSDDTPAAPSTTPPLRHGLPGEHSHDDHHDRLSLLGFIDDWAAEKGMDSIRQELTAEKTADTDWRDNISTPRLRAIIEQLLEGESTGPAAAAGHKVAARSTGADGTGTCQQSLQERHGPAGPNAASTVCFLVKAPSSRNSQHT